MELVSIHTITESERGEGVNQHNWTELVQISGDTTVERANITILITLLFLLKFYSKYSE